MCVYICMYVYAQLLGGRSEFMCVGMYVCMKL